MFSFFKRTLTIEIQIDRYQLILEIRYLSKSQLPVINIYTGMPGIANKYSCKHGRTRLGSRRVKYYSCKISADKVAQKAKSAFSMKVPSFAPVAA